MPTDAEHARDEGPAEMVLPQADRALRYVAVAAMLVNMGTAGWHALDVAGWSTQFVVSLFGGGLSMVIGAALAARVGCRAEAGGARWFWWLLAGGYLGMGGASCSSLLAELNGESVGYGIGTPVSRVFAIATMVLVVVAILRLPVRHARAGGGRRRLALDMTIVMLATVVYVSYFMLAIWLRQPGDGVVAISTLLRACGVLVVVFAVTRVMVAGSAAVNRLTLGLFALAGLTEVVRAGLAVALADTDRMSIALAVSAIFRALLIAVPLVAMMAMMAMGSQRPASDQRRRPFSLLPYAAVAATYALLVPAFLNGPTARGVIVLVGAIAMTALVVIRQASVLTDNARLLGRLDTTLSREQRLAEAGTELIGVGGPEDIYRIAAEAGRALLAGLSAATCSVAVVAADYSTAQVVAVAGDDARPPLGSTIAIPSALAERLVGGEPLVCDDVFHTDAADETGHCLLALVVDRRLVAVLTATADGPIGADAVKALDTLRTQLTLALENAASTAELRHLAMHDPLTGLANRAFLHERLRQALARSRRHTADTAVLLLDLDRFKQINDTLGHEAGDEVLREVARRIDQAVRTEDTAARLGGDEFAVLVEDLADDDAAVTIAERITASLGRPVTFGGHPLSIGASIGIAYSEDGPVDPDDIMRRADAAMYHAKREGLAHYCAIVPDASSLRRTQIATRL
ncbi:GGDEF domain-containing protein [Actinoplanes sp. NPDC089786]|uniref:GGDEF domain-containing protein n=1 Tax=Actinoplanes sp. NPDC089786 TaxID=3155185 RepID=UPI00341FF74A